MFATKKNGLGNEQTKKNRQTNIATQNMALNMGEKKYGSNSSCSTIALEYLTHKF